MKSWEQDTDISGLVKKTDYNAKISDIQGKYFSASDYNKFTSGIFDMKSEQATWGTNSNHHIVSQHAIKKWGENRKTKSL